MLVSFVVVVVRHQTISWYKTNNIILQSILIYYRLGQSLVHCGIPLLSINLLRLYESVERIIIASGNGLLPVQRQAITWTNAYLLSIGHSGTKLNEILIKIQTFSVKKMHFKNVVC